MKIAGKAVFNYFTQYFANFMNKLSTYIKASYEEMKKVTWPSKKETTNYTILVIIFSLAVALFLGLLDYLFSLGLAQIITKY